MNPTQTDQAAESPLQLAIRQIEFARNYTYSLLADVDDSDWFSAPSGVPTHIAWQVGHLAMAQYGLTMLRVRGRESEDAEFISKEFIRLFQKQSAPSADASQYPSPEEIRGVLEEVHRRSLAELKLKGHDEASLNEPLPEPHALFATKLGSIFFCPMHEMIHAGQIGLLRRMLGKSPIR